MGRSGDYLSLAAMREQVLSAAARLDGLEVERLLDDATRSTSPRDLLFQLVLPLLEEVGERWFRQALRPAQEHAVSAIVRSQLGVLLRLYSPRAADHRILVTTLAGELHELGALSAALLAAIHGWQPIYLGPSLPADEIVYACLQAQVDAVGISIVTSEGYDAELELRLLLAALPREIDLVVGGRAAASHRAVLGRARLLGERLEDLEPFLDEARSPREARP